MPILAWSNCTIFFSFFIMFSSTFMSIIFVYLRILHSYTTDKIPTWHRHVIHDLDHVVASDKSNLRYDVLNQLLSSWINYNNNWTKIKTSKQCLNWRKLEYQSINGDSFRSASLVTLYNNSSAPIINNNIFQILKFKNILILYSFYATFSLPHSFL